MSEKNHQITNSDGKMEITLYCALCVLFCETGMGGITLDLVIKKD